MPCSEWSAKIREQRKSVVWRDPSSPEGGGGGSRKLSWMQDARQGCGMQDAGMQGCGMQHHPPPLLIARVHCSICGLPTTLPSSFPLVISQLWFQGTQ